MVVEGHTLSIFLHRPRQGNSKLNACEGYSRLEPAVHSILRPCREDGEQVALDQVRFVDASRNIHAVRLFVVKSYPSFKIAENLEGIVSKLIAAVIVCADTAKLGSHHEYEAIT